MIEILFLFGPSLLASIFSAGALASLGPHLILRQLVFQLFPVHQFLMFLGLVLGLWIKDHVLLKWVVLGVGFLPSYFMFKMPFKNRESFLIVLYLLGLSLNLLIVRFFSELEIHFTRGFFGDPTLISYSSAAMLLILGAMMLVFLVGFRDRLLKLSFELSTFSMNQSDRVLEKVFRLALTFILMGFLLEWGFLFCLAALFLPAILLSSQSGPWSRFQTQLAVVAASGCLLGFLSSIFIENVAATPAIVLGILISSLCCLLKAEIARKIK
ncbi:MAG: metal ABC transporter permease [Bdellovibrionota bacterium]